MHRNVAAAIVAALALGIASCGSSEGPELTRAQLASKIEIACRESQKAGEEYARSHRDSSKNAAVQFLARIVASQQAILDDVDDLNAPKAAEADFKAFKQGTQDRIDLLERLTGAGSGIQRAIESVRDEGEAITARVEAAAKRLGAAHCG